MSEWRPIETAPKDGTPILCWWQFNETKWNKAIVAFYDGEWRDEDRCTFHTPDYWMPEPSTSEIPEIPRRG